MALSPSATLEAVLFAAGEPMTRKRLVALFGITEDMLGKAANELREDLHGSGLALIETAEELELRTVPEAADMVKKLRESELSRDLGKAGLEALAIILYQGSATRGQIDWVRGVNSGAAIRSLMLRGLIERTEDPNDKRRALYTTTVEALAHLGIAKKEDLPDYERFAAALTTHAEASENHD